MTAAARIPFAVILALLALTRSVYAFSFSFSSRVQQCSNLSVTWDGGVPPFNLLMVPVGALQGTEIRTIVDETIQSGNSHSFQLKFPSGSSFIAMMSDATGTGTGGTSILITVLDGPTDCLATSATSPLFYFFLDPPAANPAQCGTVGVSWDAANAQNPVRVTALVPGGDSISLNVPSSGAQPINWQVPFPAGTDYMLVAGDPRGFGVGGSSEIFTVQSGSNGCINGDSPSSTQAPPAGGIYATGSGGGTVTGAPGTVDPSGVSDPGNSNGGGNGGNIGAIIGGVVGGLAGLASLILVLIFFRRRQNLKKGKATRGRRRESVDLLNDEPKGGSGAVAGSPILPTTAAPGTARSEAGESSQLMSQIGAAPLSTRRSESSLGGTDFSSPIYAQYASGSKRGSAPSLPPIRLSTEEGGAESAYASSANQALQAVGGTGARSSGQFPPSAFRRSHARPETPSTSDDTSLHTPATTNPNRMSGKLHAGPPPGTMRPVNFVLHEDGGELPMPGAGQGTQEEEIVELPPSYHEVRKNSALDLPATATSGPASSTNQTASST